MSATRMPARASASLAWRRCTCAGAVSAAQQAQPRSPRPAQGGGDEPIEISSDRLVLEQNQQLATFTGNVDAVQGDTTLRTDMLRVFYTSDEEREASGSQQSVKRLEADGNVIITQPGETAEGDSGVYDLAAGKMVLIGQRRAHPGQERGQGRPAGRGPQHRRLGRDGEHGGRRRRQAAPQRVRALFVPEPEPRAPSQAMTAAVAPDAAGSWSGAPRRAAPPSPAVADGKAVLSARHLAKHYGGRTVLRDVSLEPAPRRGRGPARPERRRQDHLLLHHHRPDRRRRRPGAARTTRTSPRLPMYRRARLGIGYLPQEASIFRGLNVEDNVRAVLEVADPRPPAARGHARAAARRVRPGPAAALAGAGPFRRRAAPGRDRARPGGEPELHPARRAAGRHRPDQCRRDPRSGRPSQGSRARRADHRPQCPRHAGHHRPRLHPARRRRAARGHPGRDRRRSRRSAGCISESGSASRRPA